MTRRQIMSLASAVIGAALLSALVAYRFGLRRGSSRARPGDGACVDFKRAGEHLGEQTCIIGRVLRVYTSRTGNTFLDFCADYHSCPFTTVIFASDRPKFGKLDSLAERAVEVRGQVRTYQGQAEIVISSPDQIQEAP
jgi:hypothetical protein